MATYVIGDIHGCFDEFIDLLETIEFDPQQDTIYLVGDLVNRGPKSLETIEYIMQNRDSIFPILGNHDLSYLVYAEGHIGLRPRDTYESLLNAPNRDEIIEYLRHLPLMIYRQDLDIAIVHAGIPPMWSIEEALGYAKEAEAYLRTFNKEDYHEFTRTMFGNTPSAWSPDLTGIDRIRYIINAFTRMRLLHEDFALDLETKEQTFEAEGLTPWFSILRKSSPTQIIFGHWASLGFHEENATLCIDSGCVWQGEMTAVEISSYPFKVAQVKSHAGIDISHKKDTLLF